MNNYSSFKLELLGLKWAVTEKFRGYLLGAKCTVLTDNNPLSHLQTAKLGAIEQRWAAELALFDLTINYRPGRQNHNADALSRNPVQGPNGPGETEVAICSIHAVVQETKTTQIPPNLGICTANVAAVTSIPTSTCGPTHQITSLTMSEVSQHQELDGDIAPIRAFVSRKRRPNRAERESLTVTSRLILRQWQKLRVNDGCLVRTQTSPTGEHWGMTPLDTRVQSERFSFCADDATGHRWKMKLQAIATSATGVRCQKNLASVSDSPLVTCSLQHLWSWWPWTSLN